MFDYIIFVELVEAIAVEIRSKFFVKIKTLFANFS